jgi:hypothetical protein
MHYARANQQIHLLMRDRVEVSVRQPDGTTVPEKLTVIDWENLRTTTSSSHPSYGSTPICITDARTSSDSSMAFRSCSSS